MGKAYLEYEGGQIYVDEMWSPLIMKGVSNFEQEKVRFIKEHIRPGHTFIDVGACEGFFSLLAARFVGYGGRVIAIEPEQENYKRLHTSIRANGYHNIQTAPYAISSYDEHSTKKLWLAQQVGRHTLRESGPTDVDTHTSQDVAVMSLDATIKEMGIDEFDGGMKIDVEGEELRVLNGGRDTLRQCSYVAIDIHRAYGIDRFEVERFLNDYDFIIDDDYSRDNEVFAVRESTLSS